MADENKEFLPALRSRLRTLRDQLEVTTHPPFIGVTQGGSSRKNAGARVAATDGRLRPPKQKE